RTLGRSVVGAGRQDQGARDLEPGADDRSRQCAGQSRATARRRAVAVAPGDRYLHLSAMTGWCRRGSAVALAGLLSACATVPRPIAAPLPWAQRLPALQAISHFE